MPHSRTAQREEDPYRADRSQAPERGLVDRSLHGRISTRRDAACAVEEYPTTNGPADYALFVNGLIVGLVEAKREAVNPQEVLNTGRALRPRDRGRARCNFNGLRVPFIYATNGHLIAFRDVRDPLNRSRSLAAFHTPGALLDRLHDARDEALRQLRALPFTDAGIRPYQIEANAAIEQAIADRAATMLVAMATGTGKTFTLVNQVYRLMKAGRRQARPVPGRPPRARGPGRPRLRLVRARAGPEVRQDLRGLQPALPARGLRRGREVRPEGPAARRT